MGDAHTVARARSLLFVRGDQEARFSRAAQCGADVVVLDLEDGVPMHQKALARESAARFLGGPGTGIVRINAVDSENFHSDCVALQGAPGLVGVMVPMATSASSVSQTAEALKDVPLVALIETADGVANAREIAAVPQVVRLAFGSLDFALDIGAQVDAPPSLVARSCLILASRVAGLVPPVDGVTVALDDAGQLAEDTRQAVSMGFGGKLCIHPKQVTQVNTAFAPTESDVAWARQVLAVSESGEAVRMAGEMVDRPGYLRALRILAASRDDER